MRQIGHLTKRFKGDAEAARQHLGLARTLLGRMKAALAGASGARLWNLPDGLQIRTASGPHGDSVEIIRPRVIPDLLDRLIYGAFCTPASDDAVSGWGPPVTEDNAPLGTPNNSPAQALLRANQAGVFFNPGPKIKRFTNLVGGNFQWVGRERSERVWYTGPSCRAFGTFPVESQVIVREQTIIPTTNSVLGAAIYREEDGTGLVTAQSGPGIGETSFYRREGDEWVLLGTYTQPDVRYAASTMVFFNRRGNEAAWCTTDGGVIRATLTASDVAFTVEEEPVRVGGRFTVTGTSAFAESASYEPAPEDSGSASTSSSESITEEWERDFEWVALEAVGETVVSTLSAPFSKPVTVDFDGDTLLIGRIRVSGFPIWLPGTLFPYGFGANETLFPGGFNVNPFIVPASKGSTLSKSFSASASASFTYDEDDGLVSGSGSYVGVTDDTFTYQASDLTIDLLDKSGTLIRTLNRFVAGGENTLEIVKSYDFSGAPDDFSSIPGSQSYSSSSSASSEGTGEFSRVAFFDLRYGDLICAGREAVAQVEVTADTVGSGSSDSVPSVPYGDTINFRFAASTTTTVTSTAETTYFYEVWINGVRRRRESTVIYSGFFMEPNSSTTTDSSPLVSLGYGPFPTIEVSVSNSDSTPLDDEFVEAVGLLSSTIGGSAMTARFAQRLLFASCESGDANPLVPIKWINVLFADGQLRDAEAVFGIEDQPNPRFTNIGSF